MNHIELFAGCGGLSLGFKTEGFELTLANELSPMAAETFAFNHLNEDLETITSAPSKTFWIKSSFPNTEIKKRLRERPFLEAENSYCDLDQIKTTQFQGSLLVGGIIELNTYIESRPDLLKELKSKCVDVVSGGPPCQSFSMAGLRKKNNLRNQLPWEFARFVKNIKPKIALLENVTGILRPFLENGVKYYAWLEVAKAFAKIGYAPICLHLNAKYVGAAQNRPRYVMIAVRSDIARTLLETSDNSLKLAIQQGTRFQERVSNEIPTTVSDFYYFDINQNSGFFTGEVFSSLATQRESLTSVKDAISDLLDPSMSNSAYVDHVNSLFTNKEASNKWKNHEQRRNNPRVKARFRLYQLIARLGAQTEKDVKLFLKNPDSHKLSTNTLKLLEQQSFLDLERDQLTKLNQSQLIEYLSELKTKKQTQKALVADRPAPAALSIPDDACHWNENHPRTLTVREMARIQSFPDWFEFRSKVTTGGKMRRFEVPQYTQVGNAVPPLLAKSLAKVVKQILILAQK